MVLPGGRLVELGFIAAIEAKCARRSPTEIVTPSLTPPEEWSSLERGSSVVAMIELATERKTTPITARQREVVALIAAGYSNDEVGVRLGISPRTAKAHCDVLRHKLGVPRRRQIPIAFRLLTGEDPLSAGRRYLKAARLPR
jgi:DNA-binding CsgD family transcriptional regulator